MTDQIASNHAPISGTTPSRFAWFSKNTAITRGVSAILIFLVLWEIGSRLNLPSIGLVPPPSAVAVKWLEVLPKAGYWDSWVQSFKRVLSGFLAAMIVGIPFGLCLAVNKYFRGIFFAPFEILRPIPPLAWVPASLIFWPTNEMSIAFVTFLANNRRSLSARCPVHGSVSVGSLP